MGSGWQVLVGNWWLYIFCWCLLGVEPFIRFIPKLNGKAAPKKCTYLSNLSRIVQPFSALPIWFRVEGPDKGCNWSLVWFDTWNTTTCFNIRRQDEPSRGTALGPARLARGRNGTTGRAYEDQTAAEVVPFRGTGACQTYWQTDEANPWRFVCKDSTPKKKTEKQSSILRATEFVYDYGC